MPTEEKHAFIEEIKPLAHQKIFFSFYDYYQAYYIFNRQYVLELNPELDVLLVCAIARTDYLLEYLEEKVNSVIALEYEDHHFFNKYDIAHIKKRFDAMESEKKLILTTEKDMMRLELHKPFLVENQLPIFALPVQVGFHFDEGPQFDQEVKDFLLNFKV